MCPRELVAQQAFPRYVLQVAYVANHVPHRRLPEHQPTQIYPERSIDPLNIAFGKTGQSRNTSSAIHQLQSLQVQLTAACIRLAFMSDLPGQGADTGQVRRMQRLY